MTSSKKSSSRKGSSGTSELFKLSKLKEEVQGSGALTIVSLRDNPMEETRMQDVEVALS